MRDDMNVTPLDIQQHQFSVRFRGFDVQEVDEFLEQIAHTLEALYEENERLDGENQVLRRERDGISAREEAVSRTATDSEKLIDQMHETARKSAEVIIADAEIKAEKIIGRASNRLAQIHEDIIQLKSQRIQMEAQLHSIIDAHSRLLEMGKTQMQTRDEDYEKSRGSRQAQTPAT